MIRYWTAIRQALQADKDRRRVAMRFRDTEFLPAAMEAVEKPVSPTSRATAWILLVGLAVCLLWTIMGRIDVVASATGRIVPAGNTKIVQSAGSGIVAAIHVKDGDRVRLGQLLVELDTTMSSAELGQASKALMSAELDVARNRALVDALDGKGVHFAVPPGTPSAVVETQKRLIRAQLAEVEASAHRMEAERSSTFSQGEAARAERTKLDSTLPILDHELSAMRRLDEQGYAPGLRLLELERQRRSTAGDSAVAGAQERRAANDARKYAWQIVEMHSQVQRETLSRLAEAESNVILKREDVTKARRRSRLQHLVSPADGTVQQLALHTIGGVVEPARTLMIVVPTRAEPEIEAQVLNRDAGFVREGQRAEVKVDAFPFTRYGTVRGKVVSLNRDALSDTKSGGSYIARIRPDHGAIQIDGRWAKLTPGLRVTVDIQTGRRRIISWLLSPLQTAVSQADRER